MPRLVFVDSGVLIAAARGQGEVSARAMAELDNPDHSFASSDFVKLEVLPKPVYLGKDVEADFYREFFRRVSAWAESSPALTSKALDEATACGLSAMDALHVASAVSLKADELVTTEKPGAGLSRSGSVRVRSIYG